MNRTMGFIRKNKIALSIFMMVIVEGTLGFYVLEPGVGSLLDSFFFTLITVTSVGYGDIVPITTAGKVTISPR